MPSKNRVVRVAVIETTGGPNVKVTGLQKGISLEVELKGGEVARYRTRDDGRMDYELVTKAVVDGPAGSKV